MLLHPFLPLFLKLRTLFPLRPASPGPATSPAVAETMGGAGGRTGQLRVPAEEGEEAGGAPELRAELRFPLSLRSAERTKPSPEREKLAPMLAEPCRARWSCWAGGSVWR